MAEITPLLMISVMVLAIIFFVGVPLLGALSLYLTARLLKFKKTDFKTALYCVLIVFGVMVAVISILSALSLTQSDVLKALFALIAISLAFISGFYVTFRFYNESIGRCIVAWLLACAVWAAWIYVLWSIAWAIFKLVVISGGVV